MLLIGFQLLDSTDAQSQGLECGCWRHILRVLIMEKYRTSDDGSQKAEGKIVLRDNIES